MNQRTIQEQCVVGTAIGWSEPRPPRALVIGGAKPVQGSGWPPKRPVGQEPRPRMLIVRDGRPNHWRLPRLDPPARNERIRTRGILIGVEESVGSYAAYPSS